ncbi:hypothetical protein [Parablautia intestinalis]|uniref:hypothetical protein n=1 Tax=Parablautia intestinalis TaxID=2320100 RepID=UPI002412BD7F|nr:hypothetical protein [Parablautia intestinalis]
MVEIVTAAVIAAAVSVICCKISAKTVFNIIDKYVADMIHLAKDAIRDAYFKNERRTIAHDVNKVVERLEVNSEYKDGELFIRLDDAIEIVKEEMN